MSSDYSDLLDASIRHLEDLKARGTRFVPVSPETLQSLGKPVARSVAPSPASRPVVPAPIQAAVSPSRTVTSVRSASSDPKEMAMTDLLTRASACVKCAHLAASRRNVVFGVGNVHSPLLFVGEAPGADEDEQGEPFVGKAGQLLTKIIQAMGFQRDSVYIANILKCRPDTPGQAFGNRKPTAEEMQTCLPYLQAQIEIIHPRVMVALGATAVAGLLGNTTGITRLRGNWQEFRGIPVMPTYHPAYLLRNQSMTEKRKVWEDMLQVLERLEMPISEKQRGFFQRSGR